MTEIAVFVLGVLGGSLIGSGLAQVAIGAIEYADGDIFYHIRLKYGFIAIAAGTPIAASILLVT